MLGATKIGRCPGCRGRFGTDKSQQWPVENDAQQVFSVYICCFLSMRHDWRAVPPALHMRVQVASCVQRCRWAAKIISRMQTDPEASSRIQQAPPLAVELLTLTLEIVLELHDGTAQLPFDIGHRRPIVGLVLHAQLDHVHVA